MIDLEAFRKKYCIPTTDPVLVSREELRALVAEHIDLRIAHKTAVEGMKDLEKKNTRIEAKLIALYKEIGNQ